MLPKLLLTLGLLMIGFATLAQEYRVYGRITNKRMEPIAFATVEIKEFRLGTTTKEDGSYELRLGEGKYDLAVTMIGYKSQLLTIIIKKTDYLQNIILEEESREDLSEVVIHGKAKDRSEEFVRQVIRRKEATQLAAGAWSCDIYIKSTQEDSSAVKNGKKKKKVSADSLKLDSLKQLSAMNRMAMAEVLLRLDFKSPQKLKEERTGIKKRGNVESLFFLSTTEGNFDFYQNLVKIPALSETPFLSPISYSGLVAYKYRLLKTEVVGNRKIYTISVRPKQMSNATVEGEIRIMDSSWVLLHTRLRLPSYHLPEYDFFEVEQNYDFVNQNAWMLSRQQFTYYSKSNRGKKSGQTIVAYRNYELNKEFSKDYFGTEVSATALEAYERDSSFWKTNRTEPLTLKELRFIQYKDSVYRATHTKVYLDSVDSVINRITWKKIVWFGQVFNNHEKERRWNLPPVLNFYQPFQFGGTRISVWAGYSRTFKSRKTLYVFSDVSYGIRNKDINGGIRMSRLYNPFSRGYFSAYVRRNFEPIFRGDAWINMISRKNVYLNNTLGFDHSLELVNGLKFTAGLDLSIRRSVSDYKTNPRVDSLFPEWTEENQAIAFDGYNAFYGHMRLQYTPWQRYIREPREKIILGSAWPTFYASYRKGIPGLINSKIDFDYLEFGMEQELKIGLLGISNYTVKTGTFLSRKDLRLVDYKYQRRGDPMFFMNPSEAFQALDSSFPLFRRFYQGHYLHQFNGALLNKIPLFKKIGLREIAGAGFLIAPERNLRYGELFTGVERAFKIPFNIDGKFKLGVYVVASVANQFRNPVMFKIGITTWDRYRNRWN